MPDPNPSLVPGPRFVDSVKIAGGRQALAVILVDSQGNLLQTSSNGDGTCVLVVS